MAAVCVYFTLSKLIKAAHKYLLSMQYIGVCQGEVIHCTMIIVKQSRLKMRQSKAVLSVKLPKEMLEVLIETISSH